MSVALYAEFTALEGRAAEVAALLEGLTRAVRAEPGNVLFEPSTRVGRPREFFVYEVYRDAAAFEAHVAAAYGREFNAALAELIEGDGSVLTWLAPLL